MVAPLVSPPEAGFFKIPLSPGSDIDFGDPASVNGVWGSSCFGASPSGRSSFGAVEVDISWIGGVVLVLDAGFGSLLLSPLGAPRRVGTMLAGIWTERGSSFPLLAILGVPMFLESVKPVWASILCNASSESDQKGQMLRLGIETDWGIEKDADLRERF